MLSSMHPRLKLTGFLESFHGEQGLVLQIEWTDVRYPLDYIVPDMDSDIDEISHYSSLQRIPYDSISRLPPSELDISRSFSAAEFSTQCSLYLAPKIASFVSDRASSLGGISPPSLFIIAELKTNIMSSVPAEPIIPRRQDPFRQPRWSPLRSCFFYDDYLIPDWMEVRGFEIRYPSERNRSRAGEKCVPAISKLKKAKLVREDKEAGDCIVCLEKMSTIEELLTMPCDHIFHEQCILSWLEKKNSCPLCRSQLQD